MESVSAAEGLDRIDAEVVSRLRVIAGLAAFEQRVPDDVLLDCAVKLSAWARLHLAVAVDELSIGAA